ncbi:universal stress protein [Kitasatospora sp. RB6PN24]|uniref:universal stress protein n=1 Tax=Kitasatospora humi TaxID=2893891 RepID=UPI001E5D1823|nr:universal stress protein [Kitasatospora humi]MCC9306101.1 universal stress protein [Kitasatospora humi]
MTREPAVETASEPAALDPNGARPTIVVGVDGSASAAAAVQWAARQAKLEQADVLAVIAWDYPALVGLGVVVPSQEIEDAAGEALAETITRELGSEPEVPVAQRVVYGYPAEVLLDASRDAHLLVVGSRGLGGFAGTVLGSVGRACVEHAACPVVVVRGPETGHHHGHGAGRHLD